MKLNLKKENLKKINTEKIKLKKPELNKKRAVHGSYSMVMTVVVIAAAILLNLIVSEIPSQYTQIDLSSQQLSVLTDQTKELLSSLDNDMTIYYLTQDSNRDSYVSRLLERYDDASNHITVVEKDPVLYPKFASQYTDESLAENSVIIVCGEQSRVIAYGDMYESEFNYNYYSYETTGFDAEGQITSAIAALDAEEQPKVYLLTGHNELALSDALNSTISKENIVTESLNLVSAERVPEDADALMIVSPQQDLSDAETIKILNYLKTGGRAVIITDYTETEMPNLDSVLEYYGMTKAEGAVLENNNNYYVQVPYYLLPDINSTEVSSDLSGGSAYVLLAAAQGLQVAEEVRESLDISSVLSTSDSAYSKIDVQNMTTYEKEEGDVDGPFALGMIVTETVELTEELLAETSAAVEETSLTDALGMVETSADDADKVTAVGEVAETDETELVDADEVAGTDEASDAETDETETSAAEELSETEEAAVETAETRIAVFTSSSLIDESADQMVSGGNYRLFENTLSWLCGSEASVSVPVKSLAMDYLIVSSASGNFWSIMVIVIIPLGFLAVGLSVWLKRRKQ